MTHPWIYPIDAPARGISATDLMAVPREGFHPGKDGNFRFAAWIWAMNHHRDDPVGDLARDARQDPDWPFAAGRKELRKYLKTVTHWDAVLDAMEQAWTEYNTSP